MCLFACYACLHVYVGACVSAYVRACVSAYVRACVRACVCVCLCVCVCVCIRRYVRMFNFSLQNSSYTDDFSP